MNSDSATWGPTTLELYTRTVTLIPLNAKYAVYFCISGISI